MGACVWVGLIGALCGRWKEEDDDEGDMMDFFFKSDSLAFSNAAECDEPEDVVPSTPCTSLSYHCLPPSQSVFASL